MASFQQAWRGRGRGDSRTCVETPTEQDRESARERGVGGGESDWVWCGVVPLCSVDQLHMPGGSALRTTAGPRGWHVRRGCIIQARMHLRAWAKLACVICSGSAADEAGTTCRRLRWCWHQCVLHWYDLNSSKPRSELARSEVDTKFEKKKAKAKACFIFIILFMFFFFK